jgi:DNA-binding CsgD family transcriptional regulator
MKGLPSADLVDSLLGRCAVLRNTADLKQATADASTALELARRIGYATGEAMALMELSLISSYADEDAHAVEWAWQAQRIDRDGMPGWLARKVAHVLPWVLIMSGSFDGVLELCVDALEQSRTAGDLSEQADLHFMMSVLARETGRVAEARAHLSDSVEISVYAGYRMRLVDVLEEGGFQCAMTGRYAEAITLWSALAAQGRVFGSTPKEERMREGPLREARQALDGQQIWAAEERGAAMTLAAAVEFALMLTAEKAQQTTLPAPRRFSSRERELITLVAQGKTDVQIAEKLFISVSTVRTHLDRIRDKSGCRRRADLTRLALEEGII